MPDSVAPKSPARRDYLPPPIFHRLGVTSGMPIADSYSLRKVAPIATTASQYHSAHDLRGVDCRFSGINRLAFDRHSGRRGNLGVNDEYVPSPTSICPQSPSN